MDMVLGALNFLFIYILVKSLFNFFSRFKQATKSKEDAWQEVELEKEKAEIKEQEVIEMVTDHICGCAIPKSKAYIVAKNGAEYYFCSWECREKFIKGHLS